MAAFTDSEPSQQDVLVTLEPANPDTLNLRVWPKHVEELRNLLAEESVEFSTGQEFSSDPIRELLVASVENPAFWLSLSTVITKFWRRHRDKSVEVSNEGTVIRTKGMSALEVQRIISAASEAQAQNKKEWQDMERNIDTPQGRTATKHPGHADPTAS